MDGTGIDKGQSGPVGLYVGDAFDLNTRICLGFCVYWSDGRLEICADEASGALDDAKVGVEEQAPTVRKIAPDISPQNTTGDGLIALETLQRVLDQARVQGLRPKLEAPIAPQTCSEEDARPQGSNARRQHSMKVILKDYAFEMFLGIHAFEKVLKQRVLVSVEVETREPSDFWDYDRLVLFIEGHLKGSRIATQEELCERIAAFAEQGPALKSLTVRSKKPDIFASAEFVGIERRFEYDEQQNPS